MFKKKKCKNCGGKINDSYNFCPYCRAPVRDFFEDDKEWGILGRNDFLPHEEMNFPMGFNNLFNTILKNLNMKFSDFENIEDLEPKKSKIRKGGIGISIYTSGNQPPKIKIKSFGAPEEQEKQIKKKARSLKLPVSDSKFAGLPKKEPETNIRRFSDRIVYEINMPGVKSIKDVSIIQLENSIEIKALAKNKVYYKIIPINLPVKNYNLSKEKLILEIGAGE